MLILDTASIQDLKMRLAEEYPGNLRTADMRLIFGGKLQANATLLKDTMKYRDYKTITQVLYEYCCRVRCTSSCVNESFSKSLPSYLSHFLLFSSFFFFGRRFTSFPSEAQAGLHFVEPIQPLSRAQALQSQSQPILLQHQVFVQPPPTLRFHPPLRRLSLLLLRAQDLQVPQAA